MAEITIKCEEDSKDEDPPDVVPDELPKYISSMWEIPQMYEFLCLAKETLHIQHLSMYEMERMLLMPRASKQLASIMTCLLCPSMPRSKLKLIPPMPYEFWTKFLLEYKVTSWYKVYQSKENDAVKVLEAIGVEPEFWKIFPDPASLSQVGFDALSFQQRTWLLKTVCDTLMHSKRSLHEEVARKYLEGEGEKLLGRDRHGARYIYFPVFLDGDLRVYKHNLNNKILLNVAPIAAKKFDPTKTRKRRRERRKTNRWKNGILPSKSRKRMIRRRKIENSLNCPIKVERIEENNGTLDSSIIRTEENSHLEEKQEEKNEEKEEKKTEVMDEKEEKKKTTVMEENEEKMEVEENEKEQKEKAEVDENEEKMQTKEEEEEEEEEEEVEEEEEEEEEDCKKDQEPEVNDKNGELNDSTKTNLAEDDERVVRDDISNSSKTDDEKINEIMATTSTTVSPVQNNNNVGGKSDDEKLIETKTAVDDNVEPPNDRILNDSNKEINNEIGLNTWMNALPEKNNCEVNNSEMHDDDLHNNSFEHIDDIKLKNKPATKKEMEHFNNILTDLSVSAFELIATNIESLKKLANSLSAQNSTVTSEPVRCEVLLIKKIQHLLDSLQSKESQLIESAQKARAKMIKEWTNFKNGVVEDDELIEDGARGTNEWVLGSQGCPLLSYGESHHDPLHHDDDGHEKDRERGEKDDEGGESDSKQEIETRRVLRARGVSSYIEQFTSEEESESSEDEGWTETVDPETGMHIDLSSIPSSTRDGIVGEASANNDSDQDWTLPVTRKRKSKRSCVAKRLKTFQNKLQTIKLDPSIVELQSNAARSTSNEIKAINNVISNDGPPNSLNSIKIESVHSELDIKDEGPIIDNQLVNNDRPGFNSGVQQNYVVVNTPNGPVNYVVMPNDNSTINQQGPLISVVPQVPVQPGYYVQNSQGYYMPNSQVSQVQSPYNQSSNYPTVQPMIIQSGTPHFVGPASNYVQYQQMGVTPPRSVYPSSGQGQMINQPVAASNQSMRAPPRVVQNRQIVPPQPARHPDGAVIRSTVPFQPGPRQPSPRARYPPPRNSAPPRLTGRATRSAAVRPTPPPAKNPPKTTSLIVLSDSDDEIEMIITEKSDKALPKILQNRKVSVIKTRPPVNKSPAAGGATIAAVPVATAAAAAAAAAAAVAVAPPTTAASQASSKGGLSPQIIQRMSQGGISITPVKPRSREPPAPISATQLIVVVNETGSHYALALPNGSKLILTPEQVAQIRASNNGKLAV